MRYLLAILVVLSGSVAVAQDVFWSDSYSTPDYGYGYSTQSYGWGGRLGEPLRPIYSSSWTSPDYGYGRHTSTFGFGGGYGSSFDYSPRYSYGGGYSSGRSRRYRW